MHTSFRLKDAWLYVPRDVVGSSMGSNYYTAPNPEFGAIFTYYLKEGWSSMKDERKKGEKASGSDDIAFPGWDALQDESEEVPDKIELVVRDANERVVNRVKGSTKKGMHRVAWNLRHTSRGLIEPGEQSTSTNGFLVTPGAYTATLTRTSNGVMTDLADPVGFNVVPLYEPALEGATPEAIIAFQEKMDEFRSDLASFNKDLENHQDLIEAMKAAHERAAQPDADLIAQLHEAHQELLDIEQEMRGYSVKQSAGERNPPSPQSRMFVGFRGLSTTYGPTPMHEAAVNKGISDLAELQGALAAFANGLPALESALEATGAPPIASDKLNR